MLLFTLKCVEDRSQLGVLIKPKTKTKPTKEHKESLGGGGYV